MVRDAVSRESLSYLEFPVMGVFPVRNELPGTLLDFPSQKPVFLSRVLYDAIVALTGNPAITKQGLNPVEQRS